mgnify:CR=1 FL=1
MRMDKNKPKIRRRLLRLRGFDYSQPGAYFVTVVTHGRACLFGEEVDGEMRLNEFGRIVEAVWFEIPSHYPNVESGAFCIMPNHAHAVIFLNDNYIVSKVAGPVGAGLRPAPTAQTRHPLSEIVRAFKSFTARRINELRNTPGQPVWQRNYYEHIIRNDDDYRLIYQYIEGNPAMWPEDEEFPAGQTQT